MLGNKILIIGCAGAGKTTLALKIQSILNIPVIHMDRFYWQKNWNKTDDQEWAGTVRVLSQMPSWIMDGNYTNTLAMRMQYATSIIYMDIPRWKCLLQAFIRRFRVFYNRNRVDIPENCKDRINFKFYQWIWNYPNRSRPKTLFILKEYQGSLYILKNNKEIRDFLKVIEESPDLMWGS